MPTLNFSSKRAGETDIMDESGEQRLYTSRTFIAGNIKTAIYNHLFSSDELEIEGMDMINAEGCIQKDGSMSTFTMPSGEAFIWKPEANEFMLCDASQQEIVRVKQRTVSLRSSHRRHRTALIVQEDSRNLDHVVVVCLYFLLLEERRGIFGGVFGESMGTLLASRWAAPGFGFGMS
ncbi:unnamed protein product [Peniophora sp. CBMAI 1063]|nr:unnamed protein product [Peniophora sp. CBMAI 1063]